MAGQRVQPQPASAPSQRVAATPPPRVATLSNNTTAPNVIRQMPLVHQHHTRNNNPFHLLANDKDNDDTVVASNHCSPRSSRPNLQPINLPKVLEARLPEIQLASQPTSVQPSTPSKTPPPRVLLLPKIIPTIAPRILHNHLHDLRPHQPWTNRRPPPVTKQPAPLPACCRTR